MGVMSNFSANIDSTLVEKFDITPMWISRDETALQLIDYHKKYMTKKLEIHFVLAEKYLGSILTYLTSLIHIINICQFCNHETSAYTTALTYC